MCSHLLFVPLYSFTTTPPPLFFSLFLQRLDYVAIEEEYAVTLEDRSEARREAKAKAKKRPAPPQKPFDYAWFANSAAAGEVQRSRWPKAASSSLIDTWRDATKEFFVFEGNHYLNGFLYKEVGIDATLEPGNVMPSIEQVKRIGCMKWRAKPHDAKCMKGLVVFILQLPSSNVVSFLRCLHVHVHSIKRTNQRNQNRCSAS